MFKVRALESANPIRKGLLLGPLDEFEHVYMFHARVFVVHTFFFCFHTNASSLFTPQLVVTVGVNVYSKQSIGLGFLNLFVRIAASLPDLQNCCD